MNEKTVADYIDFYSPKRSHRKLQLRTPDQCELDYSMQEAKMLNDGAIQKSDFRERIARSIPKVAVIANGRGGEI